VLAVLLGLSLVCGGAIAGTLWAVGGLLNKASDALAQMTDKGDDAKKQPDQIAVGDKPDIGEKPRTGVKPTVDEKHGLVDPAADLPAENGIDVRFIPFDFVAGIVINGRALKSPVVSAALPEEAIRVLGQGHGIDPFKIERLVVVLEPTPGGNVLFFPAGIVRFTEAVDGKAILSKALKESQEASAEGGTYFNSKTEKLAGVPVSGHIVDTKTLLIAPEPTLKKMLAAKSDGPLAQQLRRVDLKGDLTATFVMEPARAIAKDAAKDAQGQLPPDFAEAATLPDRVKAATITLNLSGDTLLKLELEAVDGDSAVVVEKLLGQGKEMFKQAYPDLRKELVSRLPPPLAKDVLDLLDKVPEGINVSRADNVVTATLKTPGDLPAFAKRVAPILMNPGAPPNPAGKSAKSFTSREHGFKVDFPADPTKTINNNAASYDVKLDGGAVQYTVVCTDGQNETKPAQAQTVLDGIVRNFDLKSLKSQRDIRLNGHAGREVVLEMTRQGVPLVITNRIYPVKKRLYQVLVTSLKSKHDAEAVRKFLDSFTVLDDATPAEDAPAGLPLKPLDKPTTTGESLRGETRAVMDASVTAVKLSAKTTLPCLTWADDRGSAFYALDEIGELRRLSYPDLKEEWKQDLVVRCAWLSASSEGLLVTPAGGREVWLLDSQKGEMKGRFAVPDVKRAASSLGSSWGVAATGTGLYVLDLKKLTATKFAGPGPKNPGYDEPVLTPDGKYLITGASGQIHRYALNDGQLRYEESSPGVVSGRQDSGVTVSPDSKRVCFPSYVGGGTGKNYTLAVFSIDDLQVPAVVLDPGGTAVAFDPAGGYIYTNNMRLYDGRGRFLREYMIGGGMFIHQILPHPAGAAVLLKTSDQVLTVTVPKK
jgi:hypothetical protein